jgi:hypothetical protein
VRAISDKGVDMENDNDTEQVFDGFSNKDIEIERLRSENAKLKEALNHLILASNDVLCKLSSPTVLFNHAIHSLNLFTIDAEKVLK